MQKFTQRMWMYGPSMIHLCKRGVESQVSGKSRIELKAKRMDWLWQEEMTGTGLLKLLLHWTEGKSIRAREREKKEKESEREVYYDKQILSSQEWIFPPPFRISSLSKSKCVKVWNFSYFYSCKVEFLILRRDGQKQSDEFSLSLSFFFLSLFLSTGQVEGILPHHNTRKFKFELATLTWDISPPAVGSLDYFST